ncbi:MAG TPA: restriction endonuclease [Terriglobales bacterium]|jgi:restriction system protein|nr:restriction endonuclease [Terriglobales bacterium]
MSIPDYQSLMLPLLRQTSDGKEHSFPDLVDALASEYKLTENERRELLPSGGQFVFANRVGWARTYMKKAGLLSAPKRGMVQITDRGLRVLKENPQRVDNKVLRKFPEFLEFQSLKGEGAKEATEAVVTEQLDPQENIEAGYLRIRKQLADDLLTRIKGCSPDFFEQLVVDLLLKMGYGGSRLDAGKAFKKSRDGGVDGIIKEDKLGLDEVFVQAKRWDEGQVGSKEIQAFVGALHGKKARKGVFITTSGFSKPAEEYAQSIQDKVILINGSKLAELLIEHGVGVSAVASYEIKKIDSDYFTEE